MTGFRDWARFTLGDEAGDALADRFAAALGRSLDTAVFHGTQPIQENTMKQMPRLTPLVHWSPPLGDVPHAIQAGVQAQVTTDPARVTCPACVEAMPTSAAQVWVNGGEPAPAPAPAPMSACPSALGTVCTDPACPVHFPNIACACESPYPNLPGPIERQCVRCGGTIPENRMAQARALAEADRPQAPDLTPAERLGVSVAVAVQAVTDERDQARNLAVRLEQDLAQAMRAMRAAVKGWPDTSWAADSAARDDLVQVIETLEAVGSPQTPDMPRSAQ